MNDQSKPTDLNVEVACAFLQARSEVGLKKYNCPTTDIEALAEIQHALEEVGDLFLYLFQAQRQMQTMMADKVLFKRTIEWFMENADCRNPLPEYVQEAIKTVADVKTEGTKP
jgi:hypothetical protein